MSTSGEFQRARSKGHAALSLSVNDRNPARGLYESVGFQPVEHHGKTWTMIRRARQSH